MKLRSQLLKGIREDCMLTTIQQKQLKSFKDMIRIG